MRETDLARCVRDWLESEGWETYAEVEYEGRRADIVAVRANEVRIVECKLTRCSTVIDQAQRWLGEANCVVVAVSKTKRDPVAWWEFDCDQLGLGEFTVDKAGEVEIRRSPVHHRLDDLGIRAVLKDQHRDFAEAGNATGERYSPFAEKARRLRAAVEAKPGIRLKDFTDGDEYQAALLWCSLKRGAIKGLEVRQGGKVYPEGFNRHVYKQEES